MTDVMKDTDMRYENMNRVTVHMDEKPVYEIVMTKDFSSLPEEMQTLSIDYRRL